MYYTSYAPATELYFSREEFLGSAKFKAQKPVWNKVFLVRYHTVVYHVVAITLPL